MAVYYAQNGSVNINSANQWNTAANGSGSFLTWPPASNDVLMANGKTSITINVNTTVSQIRNDAANGAAAGGTFLLADGITTTANGHAGTANLFTFSGAGGTNTYIIGTVYGGSSSGINGLRHTGVGTIHVTGGVTGGTASDTYGYYSTVAGTLNVTGPVSCGTASTAVGILAAGGGVLSVTGNVAAGPYTAGNGINILTATIQATITGDCTASTTVPAISCAALSSTVKINGSLISASNGIFPVAGPFLLNSGSTNTVRVRDYASAEQTYLPVAYATTYGMPATTDVRYNTTYNLGTLTGTLRVPSASSVVSGVLVDNTTGTANLLTAADVRAALGLASANLDTQLDAIPTAAEIWGYTTRELTTSAGGATAQDVWEYATRSLTEAPDVPTVEEIAAEVRTELTPELSRVANCATVESTGDQLAGLL
jgi:hypothetical protein